MPREYSRSTRVAERLRRELAELLRRASKDPRLQQVTVTDVEVTRGISYARVYFGHLDDSAEHPPLPQQALDRRAGSLRRALGRVMRLRHVPEQKFLHDRSIAEGMRMDGLIARARERDRQGGDEGEGQ